MNNLKKITLLCLMMTLSQLTWAGELVTGEVYIVRVNTDFVYVNFATSPSVNQCSTSNKSFVLSKNHVMFDEIYTLLISAYLSDLSLTVELEPVSPTNNICSISQAAISKTL